MGEYKVQFVGLAYFLHEADGRHVLFPDGREIPNVVSHEATIAIDAADLASPNAYTGWSEADIESTKTTVNGPQQELLQFKLSGQSIEIEGASSAVAEEPLDARAHNGILQPLTDTPDGPRVRIDPREANTVADIRVRRGELRAFRYPGSDEDGQGAIISELRVPHDGDTITIRVAPKDDGRRGTVSDGDIRTITVRNGCEIALVNASRPHDSEKEDETEHFNIYGQLAPGRLVLDKPRETPPTVEPSPSNHLLFQVPGVIGSSIKCSNTCC